MQVPTRGKSRPIPRPVGQSKVLCVRGIEIPVADCGGESCKRGRGNPGNLVGIGLW